MYHIAICDDEKEFIREITNLLRRYEKESGKKFRITEFCDGSDLLKGYQTDTDLIFMDIQMEKLDGLNTAEEIRKMDDAVGLFFLTSLPQYVWRGYEYGAVNYLLKPIKYARLKIELDRFFSHYHGKDEPYLSFSNDMGKYKVLYKNLRYAETCKRNVLLHFEGQEQVIYKSMKEISALLETQRLFAKCHASFIVNMAYVKSVENLEAVLATGGEDPDQPAETQSVYSKIGRLLGGYAMMWIYQALDIITTFSQSLIIFVMGETLCRKPRAKFSRWMPPVIITATTFLWTWFIVDATYKLPCVLLLLIILYMLCYKVSIRNSMIAAFMSIVFVGTIEIISTGIAEIFQFPQAVLVDDIAMAPIPIYLVCLSLTVSVSAVLYLMFRNFRYRLNNKDFIIVLLFEIVAFLLYHISVIQKIKNNLNAGFDQRFDMLLIVISVSFAVIFLYIKNNYYLKEQEQQSKIQLALLERQYKYYQDKQKDEERVCSLYHDMKNHLLLLEGSQGTDAMHQMAEQLRSQIAAYEDYIHTGNRFLDVIIKDKAEKMREKKIDFSVMIDFGGIDFIKPLDISTLFGNGIDNAIEASERLPQEERIVLVKAGRVRDFVSILIENNCIEEEKAEHDRTSKPDDFLHGFGIPNMQKSAEKYGGTCITVRKGGKFALKILLPVKED